MAASPAKKPAVYTVAPAAGGHAVCRDGAVHATPAGAPLIVPTTALAEAIAAEARAASGPFLMQLAASAIDIVPKGRDKIIGHVAAYAENDLLCHRAEQPADFAREQQETWQPLLDWCVGRFKAPLNAAAGVMPVAQPAKSLQALRHAVARYDDFRLAGLNQAVGVCGSLVLGLALAEGRLAAGQAFHAAELDASWQMKRWGEDPGAAARREDIRRELTLCESWFELLGD